MMESPTIHNRSRSLGDQNIQDLSSMSSCPNCSRTQESFDEVDKENEIQASDGVIRQLTSVKGSQLSGATRTPFTPLQSSLVGNLRRRLEQQMVDKSISNVTDTSKISPGLALLQSTPGKLRERQSVLLQKHHNAKSKISTLNVGGGVALWPEMDNMRLTKDETMTLAGVAVLFIVLTAGLFQTMHGELQDRLRQHNHIIVNFHQKHPLETSETNASFHNSIQKWHHGFIATLEDVQQSFDISLPDSPPQYQLCVILYFVGISVLLFILADNVLAHSKLTPYRIKIWVSLLVVMGTWTILVLQLLILAEKLENSVIRTVHNFNEELGQLVFSSLDLEPFNRVRQYWTTRCLPPTSLGVLTVMGVVTVQDIMYYLQYYSLPVITALLTPVFKLMLSLIEIYSTPVG